MNSFQFYLHNDIFNATECLKNTRKQFVIIRTKNLLKDANKISNILLNIEELEKELGFSKKLSKKYYTISQQMESLIKTK